MVRFRKSLIARLGLPQLFSSPSSFRLRRPELETELASALKSGSSFILYGHPKQGKTTLVNRMLEGSRFIVVHANRDHGIADIFRAFLLSAGCTVEIESTVRRKVAARVELGVPLAVLGEGQGETEKTALVRNLFVEISSANDVAYLLRQLADPPTLIVDNFEQLRRKTRFDLLAAVRLFSELDLLQIIMISSDVDSPLTYGERARSERYIREIHVPLLSQSETEQLVRGTVGHATGARADDVAKTIFTMFQGALEMSGDAALALAEDATASKADRSGSGAAELLQARMRNYLLQFLAALFEKRWEVPYYSSKSSTGAADVDDDAGRMTVGVFDDEVFDELRTALADMPDHPTGTPLRDLMKRTAEFGGDLLDAPVRTDAQRFLAYAITRFLKYPVAAIRRLDYVATPQDGPLNAVHIGEVICDILASNPPNRQRYLRRRDLVSFGERRGLVIDEDFAQAEFDRMVRRIVRLQAACGLVPAPFTPFRDALQVWSPENDVTYGDIRQPVRELIDDLLALEAEQTSPGDY